MTEGLWLTGEAGLLQQLPKRLLQSAPEGGITDHLSYDKARARLEERRKQSQTEPAARLS
ncbi:hypothetical protein ACFV6Z_31770 [Streptomyces sp. NPDC059818]|uniref:hypothetical protein n=1 Tax=Streptomyces sp. NPDC059818 TaxID=3346962 RepID=UPI003658FFEF